MARKVFISVLGIGYYSKTKYYCENKDKNVETHFIQEAMLKFYSNEFKKNDKAYLFLTRKARNDNWESPAQKNNKFVIEGKSDSYQGLEETLKGFDFDVISKDIPDGNNEEEIWEIFQKVFDVLELEDEVYFDITHAFRSIPMLIMVLINYAKFLKKINVKSITYGNWEGRDKENNLSQVINLTPFSQLQDWTTAANEYINFGSVDLLSDLSLEKINPILKETKGGDKSAQQLKKINTLLPQFVDNIRTNRGLSIVENDSGFKLNILFNENIDNVFYPLKPILKKLKTEIVPFDKENDLINGFLASAWCLKNKLYQNGFTILEESVITLICEEMNIEKNNEANRNIVNSCFKFVKDAIKEEDWKGDAKMNKQITYKIINESQYLKLLLNEFSQIALIRNDINHSGYRGNPILTKNIKKNLNSILSNVLDKLKIDVN